MILVVGATGNLGSAITRMLLGQGKSVRILARPQSNYQSLVAAGAHAVMGDLKDPASLGQACLGCDVVITTANSALRGGDDNVENVDLNGNRNLIDAAKAAGVKQFIFVSALQADATSPVPFVAAKGKTEEYLRSSGIPYTIIAPNAFMEVWLGMVVGMPIMNGQPVTVIGEGHRRHSFISAADVAAFVTASVENPRAENRRLVLGGPEPLSFRDAAGIYGRVTGCEPVVRSVRPGEPIPGLPESMQGMLISFDMYDSPIDMAETARTFGIQLTSLEKVVRRTGQPGTA